MFRRLRPLPPLLLLALALGGCTAVPHREPTADGGLRLADCPGAPHCAITRAGGGGEQIDPIAGGPDAASAGRALRAALAEAEGCRVVTDEPRYVHAECVTPLMRFRDDVEFLIRDDGRIDARSASRIGWYDWGTNRRRLESLRAAIADRTP